MPPLRIVRVHDLSVPGNLSRVSWKLSRTVLRGGTNSNVGPLLGEKLDAKQKQPYAFGMADDSVFAFAGLWERWRDPAGEFVETCTILTTGTPGCEITCPKLCGYGPSGASCAVVRDPQ